MLLSAVSVLVVAQSSSEIPEGLMNNPVYKVRHEAFGFSKNGTGRLVSTNGYLAYMSDAILKLTHIPDRNH